MTSFLFALLSAFATDAPSGIYTVCFNQGRKCHSVFNDHCDLDLNGQTVATASINSSKAAKLRQGLDQVFSSIKPSQICADPVSFVKSSVSKEVTTLIFCYEELTLSKKNELAAWIQSIPNYDSRVRIRK